MELTIIGFYKIKPLSPEYVQMTKNEFNGVFINTVGDEIDIVGVSQKFDSPAEATSCTRWQIETPSGVVTELTSGNRASISPGETFMLRGSGCNVPSKVYDMKLTILYETEVEGSLRKGQEMGMIYGPVAA